MVVEKIWWTSVDAGKRYVRYLKCENWCGYMLWIEPRLEKRATVLVEDL